ncbi:hypothetical protein SNE40_019351 [Patella caerulea]|uniref:Uncharacterized protein n=1 Tax=Patella caerulea TaxID=87958 RepID=A0AAN8J6D8_PATCE
MTSLNQIILKIPHRCTAVRGVFLRDKSCLNQIQRVKWHVNNRLYSASQTAKDPIKFTSSKAATWSSVDSFGPPPKQIPDIQVYSVIFSVASLLIYFAFLREENDLDNELESTLMERFPGYEEDELQKAISVGEISKQDVSKLKARLAEIKRTREC